MQTLIKPSTLLVLHLQHRPIGGGRLATLELLHRNDVGAARVHVGAIDAQTHGEVARSGRGRGVEAGLRVSIAVTQCKYSDTKTQLKTQNETIP
jgi:hypothetical protein